MIIFLTSANCENVKFAKIYVLIKRYWINIRRKPHNIQNMNQDGAQRYFYESTSKEEPLTWDDWAFLQPYYGYCALVNNYWGASQWQSAHCFAEAGDVICQALPDRL